jgi:bifunctional DNA-binding transcriptional regulator/antitoxin component of YhaV-PrlF toxin-antitoxin module
MEFVRIPTEVRCNIGTIEGDFVEVFITIVKDLIKISDDLLSLEI